MTHASWIGVLGVVGMVAAGTVEGVEVGSADSHVRAASAQARELLVAAASTSQTVANLVSELETSDVVVVIELKRLPTRVNGLVQVAAATPAARYLRLSLNVPNGPSDLMALLGHELRHAVEIASMPDVRDDASLATAYRRIGSARRGDGFFETEAALEAGRAVVRELAGGR
jgi:hypothetical protein